jgi:hypothetical protein
MRQFILASLVTTGLVNLTACTGASQTSLSCEDAQAILATCSNAEQPECADDSPAALRITDGTCPAAIVGKADFIGNRTWGDSCTFNWQCQQDTRHSCNHGTCFLRAEAGNACDRRDNADCETGLTCADDLSTPSKPSGLCEVKSTPVRPALFAETLRKNEEIEFQDQAADIMGIQMRAAVQRLNGDDKVRRAFHAKKHACVVGQFEVVGGLGEFAQGPLFGNAHTAPAWVRMSNGTLTMGPDPKSAIQGLAIKVMNVPGSKILDGQKDAITQDFLMVNLPALPTASSNEFVEFTKAQDKGGAAVVKYLLTHPRNAIRIAPLATKKSSSARTESYWAGNASKLGNIAVKFSVQPCAGVAAATGPGGDDGLRADLKQTLAAGSVCFDFFAQKQVDSVKQSIEDATVAWDPTQAPPVRIARITIPKTALDTPAVNAIEATCNEFSFNPWNSAPEYRPLGNNNRSRKFAYEASKMMRHSAPEPSKMP